MSELPKGWTTVALGDVVSLHSGGTPSKAEPLFWNGNIPWITSADITASGVHARSHISEEAVQRSATRIVPRGTTLLVTRTGVGKVAVAPHELAFSQDITAVVPNHTVDPKYLRSFLRTRAPYFESNSRGATIRGVAKRVVETLPLPLPPLAEQRRIAAILDRAADVAGKALSVVDLLDATEASLYRSMFQQIEAGWTTKTVQDVALPEKNSMRTGPFGSQLLKEELTDSGIPVIGIDNVVRNEFGWGERRFITQEKYEQLSRYTVHPGDVLITIMGTNGRVAVVPDDIPTAINTKHLCCITLDQSQCLPEFLRSTFLWNPAAQRYLRSKTKGAIMGGLNMGIIKGMPMPVPPLSIQKEYVERLVELRTARSTARSRFSTLNDLRESLQSRAFRGEL